MRPLPFLLALVVAAPGFAAPDPGQLAYGQMCADCHGADARGDGPKAALLSVAPADLTALARQAGGVFPLGRVVGAIEGADRAGFHREPVPMPAFGTLVGGDSAALDTPGGTVLFTRGVILSIAEYLQGLQR